MESTTFLTPLKSAIYKKILQLIPAVFTVALLLISYSTSAQNCTVNAGVGFTVCANEIITLDGGENGLVDVNGVWSQVGGPSIIIDDPSNLNSTLSGLEAVGGSDITLRLTATCDDGSLVFQDVTFTISEVTIADAGSDLGGACPGPSVFTVSGNAPGVNESGLWTSSGAGVSIDNPTNPTSDITFDGGTSGVATLTWTITNTNGCQSSDDITVTNFGGETVNAGSNQSLDNCYSTFQSTTLNASYGGDGTGGQSGVWTVVDGPNNPTLSDPTSNVSGLSGLTVGTYTLRWTVSGPCESGTDEMTITVAPAEQEITSADAGESMVFCDGRESTVLIGNTPEYDDETVLWQFVSGPSTPTISSPNSVVTEVTGLNGGGAGTYIFRYTINNPITTCNTESEVSIEYITLPALTVNGGNEFVNVACGGNTATIPYSTVGGENFDIRYEIIAGPSLQGLTSATGSPIVIPNLVDPGIYTLRVKAVSTTAFGSLCPDVSQDINIVISDDPTAANPGTDQVLACGVTSTSLQGNTPVLGTGTWYQVDGPSTATISDVNDPEAMISDLLAGIYEFKWLIDGGVNCPANERTVKISVAPNPPTQAMAGTDESICDGTGYTLNGNPPAETETGQWSVSPSSGIVFSDVTNPNAVVTGFSPSTTYTFTWTITGCLSSTMDDVVIDTDNTNGPIQADAGPDQSCLGGNSTTLAGNNPGSDTGLWTLISGSGTIDTPGSFNSTVSSLGVGENVFRWTISNGSGCTDTFDEVTISVNGAVTIASTTPVVDQCISSGGTIDLIGNSITSGETAVWTQTGGPVASIANADLTTSTVTFTESGNYTFEYEISNGCASTSIDEVSFQVGISSTAAFAGGDQSICSPTESLTLAGNTISDGYGLWSVVSSPLELAPIITDVFNPGTSVINLTKGTYVFRWTSYSNSALCPTTTDDVTITVDIEADAGDDQQLCGVTETILIGNESTNGTWSEVTSNGAIITQLPESPNIATVSGLTANTDYTFRYALTSADDCGNTSDDVLVEVDGFGTDPDAGANQILCGASSFTMGANVITEGIGTWVQTEGPATASFVNENDPTTIVNGVSTPGIYRFSWQVVNGSCTYESEVIITNNANEVATTSVDQSNICASDAIVSATPTIFSPGTWSEDAGNPESSALSSFVEPNPDFIATTAGTYTFTWTVDNGPCGMSTDDITLIIDDDAPTTAAVDDDFEICDGDPNPTINGNTPSTGTGMWSVESQPSGANAMFTSASSASTTVEDLTEPGDYELKWTITSGSCTSEDIVTITVSPAPSIAEAGSPMTFCVFDNPSLNADVPTDGSGVWTQDSGPSTAFFADKTSPTSQISSLEVGVYTFRWTVSNGSCSDSDDTVEITIVDQVSQANAGPDQTEVGLSATMEATPAETGETGTWTIISKPVGSPDPTFSANDPSTTMNGLEPGDYTFRWTLEDDANPSVCPTFDEVTITAIPVVSVSVSPGSVSEDGGGTLVYTFQTNGDVLSDLTVNFNVEGTATFDPTPTNSDYTTAGDDTYTASNGTITILNGNSSSQITVTPVNGDDIVELAETVQLTITGSTEEPIDYLTGTPNSATGTITDFESTQTIEIEVVFNSDGTEDGTPALFDLNLVDGAGNPLTNGTLTPFNADISITGDTDDFTAAFPTSGTIDVGNSTGVVSLPINDDLLIELTESVSIDLTGASHSDSGINPTVSATNNASADIIDNDVAIFEITTIQDGKEGIDDLIYRVRLVNTSGDPLENQTGTNYSVNVGYSGATGDATAGPATIDITNGNTSANINLVPSVDTEIEIEDITAALSAPTHATLPVTVSGPNGSATAAIDDDAEIRISAADGGEPSTAVVYTVSLVRESDGTTVLTNATGLNISADLAYSNASATQADFTTTFPASVDIANTASSSMITLNINDDTDIENTETLNASLSNATMGVVVSGSNGDATANVLDDDNATIVLELTATDGDEDGTDVVFTAQLTDGAGTNLTNETGSDITADITFSTTSAVNADFVDNLTTIETSGIVIPSGQGSQVITIVVDDDLLIEGSETLEATLSSPVGTTLVPATDSDIANVGDNDTDVRMEVETVSNGVEGGTDIEFRVKLVNAGGDELTNVLGSSFTGTIGFSGATIDDFTEASFPNSFTIPDGESSTIVSAITFDPVHDASIEAESLIAAISAPNTVNTITPTITVPNSSATIDDQVVWIINTPVDGVEGGTNVSYTVSLENVVGTPQTNNTGGPISSTLSFIAGSEAVQADLSTTFPASAIIADGDTDDLITLVVANDDLIEGSEDLVATLVVPSIGIISATEDDATAVIDDVDDGAGTIVNIAATQNGQEGAGGDDVIFTVSLEDAGGNPLTNETGAPITVNIDFAIGSEAVEGDFVGTYPTTVDVGDGNSSQQVILDVDEDDLIEGDEDIRATITSTGLETIGTGNDTAMIDDADDGAATIVNIVATQNGQEGAGGDDVIFTVSLEDAGGNPLTNETGAPITVNVDFAIGSEAVEGDFVGTYPTTVDVGDGNNSQQVILDVDEDDLIEGDEDIRATITSTGLETIGTGNDTAMIDDADDGAATVVNIVATQNGLEGAGGDDVIFTVSLEDAGGNPLTNETGAPITVNIDFAVGSEAIEGDFVGTYPTTVDVGDGNITQQVILDVDEDDLIEGDEDIRATITSTGLETIGTGNDTAMIDDADDGAATIVNIVATQNGQEGAGGDDVIFTVSLEDAGGNPLTNETGAPITVNIDFAVGSEAIEGDFVGTYPTTVDLGDGNSSQQVVLDVDEDDLIEGDEDIRATITSTGLETIGTGNDTAMIDDADDGAATIVNIVATQNGQEGAGGDDVIFTVSLEDAGGNPLTNETGAPITVNVDFAIGSEAVEGDFVGTYPTTVDVGDGNNSQQVILDVDEDDLIEGDEDIRATITSTGLETIGTGNDTAMIDDADDGAATVVNIVATQNGLEGAGGDDVIFTVSLEDAGGNPLTNETGAPITVNIDFAVGSEAIEGDFVGTYPTTVDVGDGNITQQVILDVDEDDLIEGDEDIRATITSTGLETIGTGNDTAMIDDADDGAATIVNIVATQNGQEGAGGDDVIFTVSLEDAGGNPLTNETGAPITVNIDFAVGSEAIEGDFVGTYPTTVDVGDGNSSQQVILDVDEDDLIEGDEDIRATITSTGLETIGTGNDTAMIDDADDGAGTIVNIAATQNGQEGAGGDDVIFTVSLEDAGGNPLTNETGAPITVNIDFAVGSEAIEGDFVGTYPTTIDVGDGNISQQVVLDVDEDDLIEGDEDIRATITSTGLETIGTGNDTATVEDEDDDNVTIEISTTQDGEEDGVDLIYTVQLTNGAGTVLTNATGIDITADVGYAGSSEQADFITTLPTSVAVSDGDSQTNIELVVNDDVLIEGDEDLTASLSNGVGGTVDPTPADADLLDNDSAPDVVITNANETIDEDETLEFSTTNGNPITIADADNDLQTVTITVTDGTLFLQNTSGLTITGNGTTSILVTGVSLAEINNSLEGAVFTPDMDFNGQATLTIQTDDPKGGTDTEVILIDIDPVNDDPVATPETLITDEEVPVNGDLSDNVTDVDLDNISFSVVPGTEPDATEGVLVLNPDGSYTFTPAENFNGTVMFTYEACDDGTPQLCVQEVVTIIVNPINDAPSATPEALVTNEDTPVNGDLSDNVTDIEGDNLTFTVVPGTEPDPATEGTVVMNPDGTFTFTPVMGYSGDVTFTYEVCDDGTPVECVQEVVTITVIPNEQPVVMDGDDTVDSIDGITSTVEDLVVDPDMNNLTFTLITDVTSGTLTFNPDGTFTYLPLPGLEGDVAFVFEVCDDGIPVKCGQATFTITVLPMDTDGDGINDSIEVGGDGENPVDTDGDGIDDYLDVDDDGDGILTEDENYDGDDDPTNDDTDGDGTPDYLDTDDDGDGISTIDENYDGDGDPGNDDTDGDGIPDYIDTDDDGDGVPTEDEDIDDDGDPTNDDTDGDGVPDYIDTDDDGDGIPTNEEDIDGDGDPTNDDTDGDGDPDYLDTDDDGDGYETQEEDADDDNDPRNDDCDEDGIPDYLDPEECGDFNTTIVLTVNGDGLNDTFVIEGIQNFPNNTVTIYNRWGNIVWETRGYDNDDVNKSFIGASNTGLLSSKGALPDGTYYYVINRGDGSALQKGFLVIKK